MRAERRTAAQKLSFVGCIGAELLQTHKVLHAPKASCETLTFGYHWEHSPRPRTTRDLGLHAWLWPDVSSLPANIVSKINLLKSTKVFDKVPIKAKVPRGGVVLRRAHEGINTAAGRTSDIPFGLWRLRL
jgi:hypothetical protein